jgi:polysaccharide biosynthesis transport protein
MDAYHTQNTMTLRDYVRILFRHKWVIIVSFLTIVGTVAIGLKMRTPMYETEVKLLITAEKQVESPFFRDILGSGNTEIALTQSEIVLSNPVIQRAVLATKLYKRPLDYEKKYCSKIKGLFVDRQIRQFEKILNKYPEEQRNAIVFRKAAETLKDTITIEPLRDTNLIVVRAREFSPIGAVVTANIIARSYIIFDLEQQLAELQIKYGKKHQAIKQLAETINAMNEKLTGEPLSDIEAIGPASVKIIEQAQLPLLPLGIPEVLIFILAVIMAPFVGIWLAFVFEYMDQTFKSPMDMERYLNVPYLGFIPKPKFGQKRILSKIAGENHFVKSYRTFSDQVYLLVKDKSLKTISITSSIAREGVTEIVLNMGIDFSARLENKVLLIDGDFRGPKLHRLLRKDNKKGFSDILAGDVSFKECVQSINKNMSVLFAGKSKLNPITLLDTARMDKVMKEARKDFDIVIIDSTYLQNYQDTSMISSYVDGVVLVVDEGKTRRQVVRAALKPLQDKNVNIIGAVLNNRTYDIPRIIYKWI